MASMLKALKKGMDQFANTARHMATSNTVKEAYDGAKIRHQDPVKSGAAAVGAGALTFLAPPVAIGLLAVKNYQQQRQAESQAHRLESMRSCLQSHGISPSGAQVIAGIIVNGVGEGPPLADRDFRMWNLLVSREPSFSQYHSKVADRYADKDPSWTHARE